MATKTREKPAPAEIDTATRERILLEAARLFRHRGYLGTTLREVADAAGIKAGSIYYHFDSKEQILGEVMDKGIQVVAAAVRERIDALAQGAAIEGHLWGLLHHGDFTSANIRIYGQIPTAAKNRHRLVRRAYSAATSAAHYEDLRAVAGTWRYREVRKEIMRGALAGGRPVVAARRNESSNETFRARKPGVSTLDRLSSWA